MICSKKHHIQSKRRISVAKLTSITLFFEDGKPKKIIKVGKNDLLKRALEEAAGENVREIRFTIVNKGNIQELLIAKAPKEFRAGSARIFGNIKDLPPTQTYLHVKTHHRTFDGERQRNRDLYNRLL